MKYRVFGVLILLGLAVLYGCVNVSLSEAVPPPPERVICNPLNLSYRFQLKHPGPHEPSIDVCHREAADPSIVFYKDKYWMFLSKSGGYWWSDDLADWTFIETHVLPGEAYAPDVRVVNGAVVFTASGAGSWRTVNPAEDSQWEKITDRISIHDPHTFQDDDGRVYAFAGCSPDDPLAGCEVNPETREPVSPMKSLFGQDRDSFGWERRGDQHSREDEKAWVEGPWLVKQNGTYYMQYAVPGTQFDIYNDSIYTADSPLGPYTVARHNPFAYKPRGFMTGAGHGCTFRDRYGNFWHAGTMRISVRRGFERRVGLFPAGFDRDGVLFCNTRFGDYPMNVPVSKWNPLTGSFAGLMLLSLDKPVVASSDRDGHAAKNAVDENVRTCWVGKGKQNEWLQVDLGASVSVKAVQVDSAEENCLQYGREGGPLYIQYIISGSADGSTWKTVMDKSDFQKDRPHDFTMLPEAENVRYLKIEILHMPGGGDCALSGFRVFGNKKGDRPSTVSSVTAVRGSDRRNANVSWDPVPGAHGYNVLWGIAKDKLYNCMQVYGRTDVQIRALSVHEKYWIAVEAFGETGVADRSEMKRVE